VKYLYKFPGSTEFFNKVLGAKLPNQYSWEAVDKQGRLIMRVWDDQTDYNKRNRVLVYWKGPGHWDDAENGAARLHHVEKLRSGGTAYAVVCIPKDRNARRRRIKSYDPYTLLVLEGITETPKGLYARIKGRVKTEDVYPGQLRKVGL